jgi:uncharacterized protein YbcC (UPF0753/DUF2309 family)
MTELSKIFILPETRQDIQNYVSNVKLNILNGENDPLKVLKNLKVLENIIDELKNDSEIKELIQNEADKFAEKTIEIYGAKITKSERTEWDFSECNDSELSKLENALFQTKAEIKRRQYFLKVCPSNFVNMETGEVINQATKKSKSIISVTLK